MSQIVVVGMLGGVGSGKSSVARLFGELGAEVIDADRIAHDCLERPDVTRAVVAAFGRECLDPAGRPDRQRLADIVFTDPERRRTLEGIIHPCVRAEIESRLSATAAADGPPRVVVLDVPLLLESPLNALCDARIFVDTPREVREERVRTTRGWDAAELDRREKNQLPIERKKAAAEYMIVNAGSLESARAPVGAIHGKLLSTFITRPPGFGSVSRSTPTPPTED